MSNSKNTFSLNIEEKEVRNLYSNLSYGYLPRNLYSNFFKRNMVNEVWFPIELPTVSHFY